MSIRIFLLLLPSFCIFSCGDSSQDDAGDLNKFHDAIRVRIYEHADKRKSDSLVVFFTDKNALYRLEAVKSFASIADSAYCDEIAMLLSDSSATIREWAGYSLGQSRSFLASGYLIDAFQREKTPEVRAALLEAIGKTGDRTAVQFFYDTDPVSDIEKKGWAKGVFWFFSRGHNFDELMKRITYLIQATEPSTRYTFASAMARYKGEWFNNNEGYIIQWLRSEKNSEIRSLLMTMLGKMNQDIAENHLAGFVTTHSADPVIKINAIRALAKFEKIDVKKIIPVTDDKNDHVVAEALALFEQNTIAEEDQKLIIEKCKSRNAIIRAQSLRLDKTNGGEQLIAGIENAGDLVTRNFFIRALGAFPGQWQTAVTWMTNTQDPSTSTSAADALIEMHSGDQWPRDAGFSGIIDKALATKDPGVMAIFATHLRDETFNFKSSYSNTTELKNAMNALALPKEIETYNELLRTINYLDGTREKELVPEYNHPIDWTLVSQIPSDQKIRIKTSKGDIVVELNINESPGSVSNFISLVEAKFFDNKIFHRVVPNFVIQDGCPRGDGWGSVDYSIRSEFALHDYRAGTIGMASAGPDTESCQWFITHLPTPHLEGRYTIFGYVTEGMEVVHQINAGDKIISIEISNR